MRWIHKSALIFVLVTLAGCGVNWSQNYPGPERIPQEIRVSVHDTPEHVTPKIVSAFLDNQLAVTSSQGGIIQSKLQRESGLTGDFEITAQAFIVPTDSGTDVRLFADETQYNEYHPNGDVIRLGKNSQGRAGRVWRSILAVANSVQPESARVRILASSNPP